MFLRLTHTGCVASTLMADSSLLTMSLLTPIIHLILRAPLGQTLLALLERRPLPRLATISSVPLQACTLRARLHLADHRLEAILLTILEDPFLSSCPPDLDHPTGPPNLADLDLLDHPQGPQPTVLPHRLPTGPNRGP